MTEDDKRPGEVSVDGLARMLRDGRITRRGFLASAAGLLGSMAAAEGLLARVAGAQTTSKNTLVVGQSSDVSKLDPQMSTTVNDIAITFNLFDNLLTRRRDGKLYPSLATEWKLVNPTTWQFKLRPNVKFHNGDRFTSADVKFSYERSYDPNAKVITKSVLNTIERIETPDPLTVVIVTKQPDPLLAARTAFYAGQIMPKDYFAEGQGRRIQRQADRHRSGEARVVGQGRPDDPGCERGLLGREARREPDHLPPAAGAGGPRRCAPQGRGGHHHQSPAGPDGPRRQGAHHEDRGCPVRRPVLPVGDDAEAAPGQ